MAYFKDNKRYSLDEVIPFIKRGKANKEEFDGDLIKLSSDRLVMFKEKGVKCVCCGIEGQFFLKLKSKITKVTEPWHFNLYAEKDGELILMTKDHIIPKSKGGPNHLSNYEPMCEHCNLKKGDKYEG
jgi:hypothetical protein